MAAQLEDGYTRIADKILEEISKHKLNGTQFRILMVVWRYTYGFSRKDHEMSLTFFMKATGIGKSQVDRELKSLIEKNVLLVTKESTFTESRKIGFNKNFDSWDVGDSLLKRVQSPKTITVSGLDEEQYPNKSTGTVSELEYQDIHSFINNSIKSSTTPTVNPFRLFESEGFGTLSSVIGDKLGDFIDTYSERWVCEAMKEAAYYQKRSLPYVRSILERYKNSGIDEPWKPKEGGDSGGARNDKFRGSNQTVKVGGNSATWSGKEQRESKVYPGRWDDTPISLPNVQG